MFWGFYFHAHKFFDLQHIVLNVISRTTKMCQSRTQIQFAASQPPMERQSWNFQDLYISGLLIDGAEIKEINTAT